MQPSAKVICDSVGPHGIRLTTIEVVMHRYVLAEFNTHRVFSRNSASSRAIPFVQQAARVKVTPAIPVEWGSNQKGMQAGPPITGKDAEYAEQVWLEARDSALSHAHVLAEEIGVHKQIVNRLLEPWMWHTVIVSSTEWQNFFAQRWSPLAQPEIYRVAEAMRDAYEGSLPYYTDWSEWHLPYINEDERWAIKDTALKQISVARCARVSYLTHDGKRDIDVDLGLFDKLVSADPRHLSPLEHVAHPSSSPVPGNFYGWHQVRADYEHQYQPARYPIHDALLRLKPGEFDARQKPQETHL